MVVKGICDAACTAQLESAELVTLPSGLQYRDIKAGTGPQPKVGYQVREQATTYEGLLH